MDGPTAVLQTEDDSDPALDFLNGALREASELLAKRFIGYGNQLSEQQFAVAIQCSGSSVKAESQDARILDEFAGCRDDDGRRIAGFVHEIGLHHQGRAEFPGLVCTRGLKSTT